MLRPSGVLARVLPHAVLVAATLAAHGDALRAGFVWDDDVIVVRNPDTRDLSRIGSVLLSPDVARPYYRPLCRASYLLDHRLFGMDPRAFHAVSLLVHAASVLVLFGLCRRLFGETWPALLAAALLAVHPVHVEAVAFVAARNNLLALAFALGATWLQLRAWEERRLPLAAASALLFFLALASKEQGAMVLPFLGAWLLAGPGSLRERLGRARLLVPHVIALGAHLALRAVALGGPAGAPYAGPGLWERLARNWYVVPAYLRLLAFPDRLSILHELPADPFTVWWLPFAWIAVALAVVALVRWPTPASTFGLLWLAVNLVPALGIVPIPSATVLAERFVHSAAVGVWIVVADAVWRLVRDAPRRRAWAGAAAALVLVALGARTRAREADWRDDLALFRSAVRAEPRSVQAHFDLGVELKDRGDLGGARREWEAALAIAPDDAGAHSQLGTLAAIEGRYQDAESHYRAALRKDPGLSEAAFDLAKVLERTGRAAEAVGWYRRALDAPELAPQARARLTALGAGP
jgi:tetratricopeptide (TPR) repeat protein